MRQAPKKMARKNAGREDIRDLRVQNRVCSELGRAKDDVAIGGVIKHPRYATYICLVALPVDADFPEVPGEWFCDGGSRVLNVHGCVLNAARVLQRTSKTPEHLSGLLHETGVETSKGCCAMPHRAGEGGVVVCQVSAEGSDEDGRWCLVGAVVRHRSES